MKYKEIIIIILLVAVIAILVKMMQVSKAQGLAISALASRQGIPPDYQRQQQRQIPPRTSASNGGGEEGGEKAEDDDKPANLKKIHKQILSLFEDGLPKTVIQARPIFNEKFTTEMDNIKFTNTMWAMKNKGVVMTEKVEGQNYWGPIEWFENNPEEGVVFKEEYLQKIPEPDTEGKPKKAKPQN